VRKLKKIHVLCEESRCVKHANGACIAFKDPAYQWRDFPRKGCWGMCQDPEEVQRIYESIKHNYIDEYGPNFNYRKNPLLQALKKCIIRHIDKEVENGGFYRTDKKRKAGSA